MESIMTESKSVNPENYCFDHTQLLCIRVKSNDVAKLFFHFQTATLIGCVVKWIPFSQIAPNVFDKSGYQPSWSNEKSDVCSGTKQCRISGCTFGNHTDWIAECCFPIERQPAKSGMTVVLEMCFHFLTQTAYLQHWKRQEKWFIAQIENEIIDEREYWERYDTPKSAYFDHKEVEPCRCSFSFLTRFHIHGNWGWFIFQSYFENNTNRK